MLDAMEEEEACAKEMGWMARGEEVEVEDPRGLSWAGGLRDEEEEDAAMAIMLACLACRARGSCARWVEKRERREREGIAGLLLNAYYN